MEKKTVGQVLRGFFVVGILPDGSRKVKGKFKEGPGGSFAQKKPSPDKGRGGGNLKRVQKKNSYVKAGQDQKKQEGNLLKDVLGRIKKQRFGRKSYGSKWMPKKCRGEKATEIRVKRKKSVKADRQLGF